MVAGAYRPCNRHVYWDAHHWDILGRVDTGGRAGDMLCAYGAGERVLEKAVDWGAVRRRDGSCAVAVGASLRSRTGAHGLDCKRNLGAACRGNAGLVLEFPPQD